MHSLFANKLTSFQFKIQLPTGSSLLSLILNAPRSSTLDHDESSSRARFRRNHQRASAKVWTLRIIVAIKDGRPTGHNAPPSFSYLPVRVTCIRSKVYLASVRHRPPCLLPAAPYLAVCLYSPNSRVSRNETREIERTDGNADTPYTPHLRPVEFAWRSAQRQPANDLTDFTTPGPDCSNGTNDISL